MKIYEKITKDFLDTVEKAKEVETTSKKYKMVVSKEVEDRSGEVVLLSGVDLKNYKKNPVVLVDHDYRIEKIVGRTTKIKVEEKELVAEFSFVNTELGRLAEELYEQGFLRASSIGFIPKERSEDRRTIVKSELLEWSLVAVPCNAEALGMDTKQIELGKQNGLIVEEEHLDDDEEEEVTLEKLNSKLLEIEATLQVLAEHKARESEMEAVREKKELLQSINKATADALHNLKRL